MTETRQKLEEAKYFLERMKENQCAREAFKYNLSAFLAASRSVTCFMQKEYATATGFKEWYGEKQYDMKKDDVMKLCHKKRTITIHQRYVQTLAHVTFKVEPVTLKVELAPVTLTITRTDGTIEKRESEPTTLLPLPAKIESAQEWRWFFGDLPDKDVIAVCMEYLSKLETLIAECESRFTL